ncbi:DDE-type integrase/transposase/recombinase [Streptomyces hundungensis]
MIPGAQVQCDWGRGQEPRPCRDPEVYSFHMTLSYSRDPFCRFTTSQDLASFFDCHRQAFAHFGGVPMTIVYDRTKTVVRRHVAPGEAVPLNPEAVAFAGNYNFDIDVLAAYRPTGRARVERRVLIVRDHAGRTGLLLDRRGECRLLRLSAAAAGEGARHPRRGHRAPGCAGSRGPAAIALDAVCGRPAASAARRQGLSGRLRGESLLGACPQGPPTPAGRDPGHEVADQPVLHRPRHQRRDPLGCPSTGS